MNNKDAKTSANPSRVEKVIGIIFAFLVFAMIAYTVVMDVNIDDNKLPLIYTLIALMAGAVVATIPGFLNIDYSNKGMTIRAAGGAAAFVIVFFAIQEMTLTHKANDADKDPETPNSFYATSYCSMTNVYGHGANTDLNVAQDLAIKNCIQNGGIPDCCASNVRVSR